jgi:hypothetical protein
MRNALLTLVLVGCATTPETPHIDLVSEAYTLQPGEEKYFCYTMHLPADQDIAITKFTPTYGLGTHHILFSQTIATEPEGFSECPVLIRSTWVPMYAGGKDSGALEMPDNTGLKPLEKGGQILMQLHLQNSTDSVITSKTSMRMDYVAATPDIVPAGVYGFDDRKLEIPAHTDSAMNQMNCKVDRDLDVFAVLGHMHKHGVHLDISRGATAGSEMLYAEDWNFETQPVTPAVFHVSKDDNVFLRCTHKNTGSVAIPYGESSDTEMCAFVMYYTPATELDGCINQ